MVIIMENDLRSKKGMLINEKITEERIKERSSSLVALTVRELNDLDDVTISSPTNGQVLKYNSTSGKWENATP